MALKEDTKSDLPSYPRLTLDFHTNKRIIDEVVRDLLPFSQQLQILKKKKKFQIK